MSSNFIVNRVKFLDEVINGVMPSAESMDFLIGYFYFSGFDQISDSLKDRKLRILVGMNIEHDLKHKVIEYNYITDDVTNDSHDMIRKEYIKKIIGCYQKDEFDDETHASSFKLFLDKIKDGTLEVRKTFDPNHAKVYIFNHKAEYSQGGTLKGTVITGSSNFTFSGLKNRDEVNVISRAEPDYDTMKKYFEELWNTGIPVFNKDDYDFLFNAVKDQIPAIMCPKPYLLYIKALYEYFTAKTTDLKLPSEITKEKFSDFKYQSDAIAKAIDTIKRHNGVIVADVVGLGKSIIGAAVAHNLGLRTLIIAPPHLKPQWEEYSRMFGLSSEVYSSGMIDKAFDHYKGIQGEKLVIVDEAHKYRNEESSTYGELWKVCQGNKVMLLTATPFNNSPSDIFSLLRLFQIPSKSTIMSVDNLYHEIKTIQSEHEKIKKDQKAKKSTEHEIKKRLEEVSQKIRAIIEPIVIRRTRIDLEKITEYKRDLELQNISFPKINDPVLLEYQLGDLAPQYISTLDNLASGDEETTTGLTCASYKPLLYVKDLNKYKDQIAKDFGDIELFKQSQTQLAKFIKSLAVRRFESSIDAFKKTVESLKKKIAKMKDFAEKLKYIPITRERLLDRYLDELKPSLFDFIYEDEEIGNLFSQELYDKIEDMKNDGVLMIDINDVKKEFFTDLNRDIAILEEVEKNWSSIEKKKDPKLQTLKTQINEMLAKDPERKIVIFSEFGDTVQYLYDSLKDEMPVFMYTSKLATDHNKEIIRANFDASYPKKADQFKVIIATDAISEGYNLNRAGTIINYDIPYNPTRVIQRIGRINRVNKKMFDVLFIYNFFPTEIGEKEVSIKRISTLKIALIQAIFGGDTKTLTSDEDVKEYIVRQFREGIEEEESWDVPYKNELDALKHKDKGLLEQAVKLPNRINISRKKAGMSGIITFAKKGDELIFKLFDEKGITTLDHETGFACIRADITEDGYPVSTQFYAKYRELKKNLFNRKFVVQKDKGVSEALAILDVLKKRHTAHKGYLTDLKTIIEKYDALPDYFARFIRKMKDDPDDISGLITALPHETIMTIITKVRDLDSTKESVIITEEFGG